MKMENQNNLFFVGDNEIADRLLFLLESNSVLSESFQTKITNIIFVIVTNLDGNEDWVMEKIIKLKEEMFYLSIFSEKFVYMINGELLLTLGRQKKIDKEEEIVGKP